MLSPMDHNTEKNNFPSPVCIYDNHTTKKNRDFDFDLVPQNYTDTWVMVLKDRVVWMMRDHERGNM